MVSDLRLLLSHGKGSHEILKPNCMIWAPPPALAPSFLLYHSPLPSSPSLLCCFKSHLRKLPDYEGDKSNSSSS